MCNFTIFNVPVLGTLGTNGLMFEMIEVGAYNYVYSKLQTDLYKYYFFFIFLLFYSVLAVNRVEQKKIFQQEPMKTGENN